MKQTEQRTGVIEMDGQAHAMIAAAAILRAQVAAKQVEIQAMRQFAADENPDLERARQELSSLETQLAAMDVAHDRRSGDLVAPKGTVSQAGLEYARALREVKYCETVVSLLMRLQEVARPTATSSTPGSRPVGGPAPRRAATRHDAGRVRRWRVRVGDEVMALPSAMTVAG